MADEILTRLSHAFLFKTSDPLKERWHPYQCTFCVAYGSEGSLRKVITHLSAIPGIIIKPLTETTTR